MVDSLRPPLPLMCGRYSVSQKSVTSVVPFGSAVLPTPSLIGFINASRNGRMDFLLRCAPRLLHCPWCRSPLTAQRVRVLWTRLALEVSPSNVRYFRYHVPLYL